MDWALSQRRKRAGDIDFIDHTLTFSCLCTLIVSILELTQQADFNHF